MRRFELVEGNSSKFWQISREGATLTVSWGKIGTAGQTQVKDLGSDAKAQAEHDKLVTEKTKKGYAEVAAGAPVAAPKPAKAAKEPAEAKEAKEDAAPAPAPERAKAAEEKPAEAPAGPPPELDWSATNANANLHVAHRKGHLRPSKQHLEADPWRALQSAWASRKALFPWDKLTIPAELRPTAEEAAQFLEGKAPVALSPLAAALVCDVLSTSIGPESYPITRALCDASVAKHGVGWLVSAALESSRVGHEPSDYQRREQNLPTYESLSLAGEDILVLVGNSDLARKLSFYTQNMPEADYTALCAEIEKRWPTLTYFPRALLLTLIPDHTPLTDALAEEWLACEGHVTGYQKPSWSKEGVKPELRFKYSKPLLLKLAKKTVSQAFAGGYLGGHLWDQFDFMGADALPFIKMHCDQADYGGSIREGLEIAGLIRGPETAALMVSHITGKKEVGQYVVEWLEKNPRLAIPALADAATYSSATADRASTVLFKLDREHPGLANQLELRPAARAALEKLRAKMADRPDASPEELPKVLTNPPWLSGKRAAPLPVVANVKMLDFDDVLHDDEGTLKNALEEHTLHSKSDTQTYKDATDQLDSRWSRKYASRSLVYLKKADVKRAFEEWPGEAWGNGLHILTPLALFGKDAIAGYPRIANGNSGEFARLLSDIVESPRLAPFFAYARTLKSARKHAERWFLKFPKAAAIGLIPTAVGAHTQARLQAENALRFMVARGKEEAVRQAGKAYGKEVEAALAAVLASDPRDQIPNKMPKMPDWCDVNAVPRPLLKGREKALPKYAVEALFVMLSISTPESTYAGIDDVIALCDKASLEEFSWALFNEWNAAGGSAKEAFGMQQLGLLGGDDVARKLTPLIRAWPGESLQARAVSGLDVLARIGTDLALMHLNGIAQKVKFKGLQEKAREKMDEVAQNRGLSADELADRLVPDLDLDEDGSRTLDFGPRQFRVGFDEALKPFVKDASGKNLGDLPKPGKSDDSAKAKEADAIWKLLKKDVKAIAQNQIVRLELAMCSLRRWENDSFRALFLEHPLLIHLTRRLIWGVYDEAGKRTGAFRVAEDKSFSDADDATFVLPDDASVGIVHPLELSDAEKAAFGQILGDYGIVQPFPQIGRDTYAPTPEEAKTSVIKRREKHVVPVGKILGLIERGWRKGQPQDAGWIWDMHKPLPGGMRAELGLATGISADMQLTEPKQELGSVYVSKNRDSVNLGGLPPVVFSELVRDLVQLGSAT